MPVISANNDPSPCRLTQVRRQAPTADGHAPIKPDYKQNADIISVDGNENVRIEIPAEDKESRALGGNYKVGNVSAFGVMTMPAMDTNEP